MNRDKLDKKILKTLERRDERCALSVAKSVGANVATVRRRLHRLAARGLVESRSNVKSTFWKKRTERIAWR